MTTPNEREALVAKWRADAAFYRAGGEPDKSVAYDRCADELAALTRQEAQQEAQGAVASTIDAGGFISDTAALALLRVIGGGNPNVEYAVERLRLSLTTPPAPVDVRVALPKVTFKNVQRGDCGKYPDGTGWGHAWSAPIVEIERADWDRFIALLSGQPAGVDDEMSRMDAVIAAHKTWPTDLRKKLSLHDLRRMSGWAPKPSPRDWRIDTSAGVPILVYQNCSVIEGEQARYVIGLIEKDGQQGLVIDDAKVRRAVHAYDEWMIEHAPDETDAYHDGMRAALTAALGGGGRG